MIPNDNLDFAHFSSLCNHQWLPKSSRKRGSQPQKLGQDSLGRNLSPPAKKLWPSFPDWNFDAYICIYVNIYIYIYYNIIYIYMYLYYILFIYIHMFYLKTSHASSAVYMQDSQICAACRNRWECTFNWIDFTDPSSYLFWTHKNLPPAHSAPSIRCSVRPANN